MTLLLDNMGTLLQTDWLENLGMLWLVVKMAVLAVLLGYIVFALTFWVQVRRLESWLLDLKRYPFARLALLHLILAAIGWGMAWFIL